MMQWMQQLIWHSLTMSLIVLVYYVAMTIFGKHYAAKWLYLVGVILLIGFLIPFRPVITVEMDRVPEFLQSVPDQIGSIQATSQAVTQKMLFLTKDFLWDIIFIVWIFGALATIIYHGIKHALFVSTVKRWCVDVEDEQLLAQFEEAKHSLMIEGRDVGITRCACIHSPMLLHLGKQTVVLPEVSHASYDPRFILLHELVHYKRNDLLCRFIMLLSTAIHWFNPIIYLLVKLVTIQCEISCDEKAVENQDSEGRHQYAMTIIGVARCYSKGHTLLTTYFNGDKDTIKKRIATVYKPTNKRIGTFLLACTLLLTLLAGTSIAVDTGGFQYTLPEKAVKFNEALDSYIVSWEPMNGIKEYHIGVYYSIQIEETVFRYPPLFGKDGEVIRAAADGGPTKEVWAIGSGWIGNRTVTDDAGNAYEVLGCWEAATLPGDATALNIGEMINDQLNPIGIDYDPYTFEINKFANKEALLECTMHMVAVREAGEPLVMEIKIPVE